jgi:hypothetical protein
MSRNTGIFSAFFLCSMINGNIYIMFAWQGKKYVSSEMRLTIFTIFAVIALAGCISLLFLRGRCCGPEITEEKPSNKKTGDAGASSTKNFWC